MKFLATLIALFAASSSFTFVVASPAQWHGQASVAAQKIQADADRAMAQYNKAMQAQKDLASSSKATYRDTNRKVSALFGRDEMGMDIELEARDFEEDGIELMERNFEEDEIELMERDFEEDGIELMERDFEEDGIELMERDVAELDMDEMN